MSTRNKLILGIVGLIVVSAVLRYAVGGELFTANSPQVSVKAEPVFSFDGSGVHFGPSIFDHDPEQASFVITNSMLLAALVTIVLTVLSLAATRNMQVVPRGLQNVAELAVDGMYNTFGSVDRKYIARFWPMVGTIFFYVLFSNWLALIPGVLSVGYRVETSKLQAETHAAAPQVEFVNSTAHTAVPTLNAEGEVETEVIPYLRSPSADLNNTLILGLLSFLFIEFWGFKQLKLGYLSKFFPFKDGPIMIFAGLLEFISEFVRIISFAFRLFGNVFAGEVILLVMLFLFPLLPLPFLGLEAFVGFIQAFVFAILVMAFASLATQAHGGHDHDEPHHAELGGEIRQGAH